MLERLLRIFGWRMLLITGDPCVLDRWLWLRSHLLAGRRRTFDAGSGNGGFSIYAARRGNEVIGASFSVEEQQIARQRAELLGVSGVDFRVIDLREIEAQRAALGSFEQIICLETIEHLSDDQALVDSLAEMLEPGGRLLLSAPFAGHRPLFTEELEPSPVEDGSHVRYGYSCERLAEIASRAGLEVAEETFISGLIAQKLTNLMRRLSARAGVTVGWLAVLPLRPLVVLDRPLSGLLRYPYLSVAVCAVRPARAGTEAEPERA
jgi:SAM-dependent methyltransferase